MKGEKNIFWFTEPLTSKRGESSKDPSERFPADNTPWEFHQLQATPGLHRTLPSGFFHERECEIIGKYRYEKKGFERKLYLKAVMNDNNSFQIDTVTKPAKREVSLHSRWPTNLNIVP